MTPDLQKPIDDARKVLFELDGRGSIVGKTALYQQYQQKAAAYAQAKKDYAEAYATAMEDPNKKQGWPVMGAPYQQKVDDALEAWKAPDAQRVEQALEILQAVGKAPVELKGSPTDRQQQIDAAKRVLYVLDNQGNITGKTVLYSGYEQNEAAYRQAKKEYDAAQTAAFLDPIMLQSWPMTSVSYQIAVDQAYSEWRAADALKVENAQAILKSAGVDSG